MRMSVKKHMQSFRLHLQKIRHIHSSVIAMSDYVTNKKIQGITKDTVLGHHGVGIFWNVEDWTIE